MAPQSLLETPPTSSPAPPSASRLLSLPAEIRIMILTVLLAGSGTAALRVNYGKHQRLLAKNKWGDAKGYYVGGSFDQHCAQVLRVSRQIYDDGIPILYGCNQFDLRRTSALPRPTFQSPAAVLRRAMGTTNFNLIRDVALHYTVKLPAFVTALKGLRNITMLEAMLRDPVAGKVEDTDDEDLQDQIKKAPGEDAGITQVLMQRRDIVVKIVLNICPASHPIYREPQDTIEVSPSLREEDAVDTGTDSKTPELHFTVVNIHRFEAKTASEEEDV